jgi:hypothetical protein
VRGAAASDFRRGESEPVAETGGGPADCHVIELLAARMQATTALVVSAQLTCRIAAACASAT